MVFAASSFPDSNYYSSFQFILILFTVVETMKKVCLKRVISYLDRHSTYIRVRIFYISLQPKQPVVVSKATLKLGYLSRMKNLNRREGNRSHTAAVYDFKALRD